MRRRHIRACIVCALLAFCAACDDKEAAVLDSGAKKDAGHMNAGPDAAQTHDAAQAHDAAQTHDAAQAHDAAQTHDAASADGGTTGAALSFFVSSDQSMTGDLGGLAGADARCERLAAAVSAGDKTWRAYLSVEHDDDNGGMATHARDRIGSGPWYNAEGVLLAKDLDALHARTGDAAVFLDENGEKIPGQWPGSPAPVEHDILTGSDADGMLMAGLTCADWTSSSSSDTAQVGHSDGLGPGANPDPPYSSWNSSHANAGCDDTAPRGGAGRIYCFATD